MSAFAGRLDAALVPPAQLAQVLADAGKLEKIFANIAAASAARMAGGAVGASLREAVTGLARASRTSLAGAAKALQAAKRVEVQPEVAAAVRSGELSRQQAGLVAGAVANKPGAAPQLLKLARGASLQEVAEEPLRARSTGQGAEVRRDALHDSRFLRYYTSTDGAFNLHGRATPQQGPSSWQRCAPWQTRFSKLPANKDGESDRRRMPGTPLWAWRSLVRVLLLVARTAAAVRAGAAVAAVAAVAVAAGMAVSGMAVAAAAVVAVALAPGPRSW